MTSPRDRIDVAPASHAPTDHTVRGVFDKRDEVTTAVRTLGERSVPADAIDVYQIDASGRTNRRIEVEDEAGALRGALTGAAIGAVVGVAIVILVGAGVFGSPEVDPLGVRSIPGAIRGIALAAAAGVPLGALIGMGHWRGQKKIDPDEVRGGRLLVVVRTAEMADVAHRVLEQAGADPVTEGAWEPSESAV